jgi:hypothetical protein
MFVIKKEFGRGIRDQQKYLTNILAMASLRDKYSFYFCLLCHRSITKGCLL